VPHAFCGEEPGSSTPFEIPYCYDTPEGGVVQVRVVGKDGVFTIYYDLTSAPVPNGEPAPDLEVANLEEMWAMLTAGAPPVQMLFDRVGPDGKGKLRDTLATIVEQRFGNGPIRLTNAATVGSGVLG